AALFVGDVVDAGTTAGLVAAVAGLGGFGAAAMSLAGAAAGVGAADAAGVVAAGIVEAVGDVVAAGAGAAVVGVAATGAGAAPAGPGAAGGAAAATGVAPAGAGATAGGAGAACKSARAASAVGPLPMPTALISCAVGPSMPSTDTRAPALTAPVRRVAATLTLQSMRLAARMITHSVPVWPAWHYRQ